MAMGERITFPGRGWPIGPISPRSTERAEILEEIRERYARLVPALTEQVQAVPGQYQQLAEAYGQRTGRLSDLLAGLGQSQREELERAKQQALAQQKQQLVSRGLTASTLLQQARQGVEDRYRRRQRQLEDMLTREKMDYLSQLTGQELAARGQVPRASMEAARTAFGFGQAPIQALLQALPGSTKPAKSPSPGGGGRTSGIPGLNDGGGGLPSSLWGAQALNQAAYPSSLRGGGGGGGGGWGTGGGGTGGADFINPYATGGGGGGGGGLLQALGGAANDVFQGAQQGPLGGLMEGLGGAARTFGEGLAGAAEQLAGSFGFGQDEEEEEEDQEEKWVDIPGSENIWPSIAQKGTGQRGVKNQRDITSKYPRVRTVPIY